MSQVLSLLNKSSAFDYVAKLFHQKYDCWFNVLPVNRGRHMILKPQGGKAPTFYVLFKREWMYEFNKLFQRFVRENPEFRGLGESVNREWLLYSLKVGADYLVFVQPDRSLYIIPPLLVKNFVEKYNLIRTQLKSNDYRIPDGSESIERINELTYCFPIRLLTRMEEVSR